MPEPTFKPPTKNLTHANTNHTPGVAFSLFFALIDNLTAEPVHNKATGTSTLTENISATGTFTFTEGNGFGSIRCAKQPIVVEKTMANGSAENTMDLSFLDSDEAKGFRYTYRTAQMIICFKDANGKFKKYGTIDFPVTISESEAKNEDGSLVVKLTAAVKPIAILPEAFAPTAPTA